MNRPEVGGEALFREESTVTDICIGQSKTTGRIDDALDSYRKVVAHRWEIGHRRRAESLRGLGDALRESGDGEAAQES